VDNNVRAEEDKEYTDDSKDVYSAHLNREDKESKAAAEGKEITGRDLIQKVCEYYFDDEELQATLETWAGKHSRIFNPFDQEYSLEQMTLFEEFRTLLETHLERLHHAYVWDGVV
jgi:hypothetical protein